MNSAGKYILLLLLLMSAQSCISGQPEAALQYRKADSLFQARQYFDAVTEFKRLLFFQKGNNYSFAANIRIAESYKGGAKFQDAIRYFSAAQAFARNDSEAFLARTGVIRCNILRHTARQALLLLDRLEAEPGSSKRIKEINYWRGWAYMFNSQWQEAAASFGAVDSGHTLKILALECADSKYSVSFAKVISYILPGFGQFYTGHYLSGLMSIGWTGLFGYLTYNAFAADRVFDGVIMAGLFFRFHRGNVQNAEKFAEEKNLEIADKALFYLQNNYEGLKP